MSVSASHLASATRDPRKRTLFMACVAHALHDGCTDLIYVMLPVWQAGFALSVTTVAALRAVYVGAMAGLQLPAGGLARRWGGRTFLALGTATAAAGHAFVGAAGGFVGVCVALAIAGCGASIQHPIASVSRVYGQERRGPLGIYNFAGNLGKSALPAAISLLLAFMPWRDALWIVCAVGFAVAAAIALDTPTGGVAAGKAPHSSCATARGGFAVLVCIGILDSAVRMGFLTYLPLLLTAKGVSLQIVGLALAFIFIGGAGGKFACAGLGARVGVLGAVVVGTEAGTAVLILAILISLVAASLTLLPLVGVMLNGTSCVLYGTVPELTSPERTERAFALFYSGTIGSGAIAPIVYGMLADQLGSNGALSDGDDSPGHMSAGPCPCVSPCAKRCRYVNKSQSTKG
jgi:MFS transporter, FSR family, fosmidomycin resistance protein